MKIFICCSKHFYGRIPEIQNQLEERGHSVILPNSYDDPGKEYEVLDQDPEEHKRWKAAMFRKSEAQIKDIDSMLVLNFEKKGIVNYIGGATFLEMYDAFRHGKKIFLYNPIPEGMLRDEITGFSPEILYGNLEAIVDGNTG